MADLLTRLAISDQVQQFFAPYLTEAGQRLVFNYTDQNRAVAQEYWQAEYNRVPSGPGIWLAGTVVPVMARHLFLFHSAAEAICFCNLYPAWLTRPGNCIFAALGLLPGAQQLGTLAAIYRKAKLHTVFGNGLLASILDCKAALWYKGLDTTFSIAQDRVCWRWRGRLHSLSEQDFSFNRFQQLCGLRTGFRTHKPPTAYASFFDLLNQQHVTT